LKLTVFLSNGVRKQGEYHVATNEEHFHELVNAHVPPPPLASDTLKASLVEMGFPKLKVRSRGRVSARVELGPIEGISPQISS